MRIFSHYTVRADMCACPDFGGLSDECRRMESGRVSRRLIEEFDSVGEGEVRVCGTQRGEPGRAGVAFDVDTFLDEHGRGARRLEKREVAPVGEKSDLARLGMFDPGDAVHGSLARAVETAAEFLGNLREAHGHKYSSLPLGASLAQREEGSTAGLGLFVEKPRLVC